MEVINGICQSSVMSLILDLRVLFILASACICAAGLKKA